MTLINCKIELKLKWTKYFRFVAAGADNTDANPNIIRKIQSHMFLQYFYQPKIIKNYQNFLAKDLKDQFIGMNIKKVKTRNTTNE